MHRSYLGLNSNLWLKKLMGKTRLSDTTHVELTLRGPIIYVMIDQNDVYIMLNSCAQSAQKQAAIARKIS